MKELVNRGILMLFLIVMHVSVRAQEIQPKRNDANTPLHALQPDYVVPYGKTTPEDVKKIIDRIADYLDAVTPAQLVNSKTGEAITDFKSPEQEAVLKPGDFRFTSYEWGVVYGGMLLASDAMGDSRYADYCYKRMAFIGEIAPYFLAFGKNFPEKQNPLRNILEPHALDDAGSL